MIYNGFIITENAMTGKHNVQNNFGPLTFGLDIGIASVGWAVLGENRIVDLGVRCFDKAETAKEGESLNLARRTARLLRRRLRRRAWRLTKLARLLKREDVIADANFFKQSLEKGTSAARPWQLRADALDRKLEAEEWARVIYHLCKHRGFHWISKAEEKAAENDNEGGRVKKGLAGTKKLMEAKKYRTAAEMVLKEFPDAQRNKHGDYSKALSRVLLADELKILFEHQRKFGNPHAGTELEAALLGDGDKKTGLFWKQEPALSGEALLKMLGKCTFEKSEYRAPKASFTAERHVWLTRLNNLRIVVDGKTRPLTDEERRIALPLPYQLASDFSYKQLRKALVKAGLSDEFRFTGLSYPSERQKTEEKAKDPEDEKLVKLPGWQELRKTLKEAGLEDEWLKISTGALEGKPQLLDEIARVLTVYKEDEEVERELGKLDLPNKQKMVDALLTVRFDKFSNLSLKALYNILPHMEAGLRYDEACEKAGYHHSQLHKVGAGDHKYLPPFYSGRDKDGRMKFDEDMDIPRNPVVLRALNQARKVVNALIREYGSPHEVHIEMARDLSRPFDERREVKKAQDEYRDRNDKDKAAFASEFNIVGAVKGKEFEKFQLYREQQGKCAYSIEPIDIHRLFEAGYVEVDHALPYSRSYDDSKNNRVLVLARENRNKGNMTPYEYLDGKNNGERWRQFVGFVEGNKAYRLAKRSRLLRKDFGEKESREFRERNLNDTRYICRFFKNYVEQYLQLHEDSEAKRCVVLSGQMTSFLRARWGLVKVRADSDRHHALDAAVVAACSHSMVKRLSDYSRRKELDQVREGFVDVETGEIVNPAMFQKMQEHFPDPWPYFRDELKARLSFDDPALLRAEMERLGTYPPEALEALRPLFVSRAPQRRNSGAAHQESIRSIGKENRLIDAGTSAIKTPLTKLKFKDIENIVGWHDQRNTIWIDELRRRLEPHKSEDAKKNKCAGAKAFADSQPKLFKPSAENKVAPEIRSVKLLSTQKGGVLLRGGVADQASMLRVDVFEKKGKHYLVPIYQSNRHKNLALLNRAATAAKPRDEWTLIDESYSFKFTLNKNDAVLLKNRNREYFGYFAGLNVATAAIDIASHDNNININPGKAWQGMWPGNGLKTGILRFEKFNVDVLGNLYPAPPEKRRDLA